MKANIFSHELRQFRLEAQLNRSETAAILGISASTLRRWEDGRQHPQSASLWAVINKLNSPVGERRRRYIETGRLKEIFENYARSLDLSTVESFRTKLNRIEKTLSSSILRASQTDFEFDEKTKQLRAVPFVEDLELFDGARSLTVRQLLENAAASADELVPKLNSTNIEQRYVLEALRQYAQQCRAEAPNPRVLERKGSLIKFVYTSEDIPTSVNKYIYFELGQFIDIHNELMRGIFGKTLSEMRSIASTKVDDGVAEFAATSLTQAAELLEEYTKPKKVGSDHIDPKALEILLDVRNEVESLTASYKQSNDPSSRELRLARIKISALHGAAFIGRLILRTFGATLEFTSQIASIAAIVEILSPGSLRAIYALFQQAIPELPPLSML